MYSLIKRFISIKNKKIYIFWLNVKFQLYISRVENQKRVSDIFGEMEIHYIAKSIGSPPSNEQV